MTIRPSIDVATRISAELSAVIEGLLNDPEREAPPQTLEEVRAALVERGGSEARETEYLHPGDETSLLVELDRLLEEYGGEASASDFVVFRASEGLSRVIQAALDDTSVRARTLAGMREAMVNGLTARLIGEGAIDEDDEGALLGEIDELIQHYGGDAPAETLIRLE